MVAKSRLIYLSHFLSTWGDRMWSFAVAIFLMDLAPESLLLPAVFGLALAGSVLMFAPLVGTLIDRMPRLRAAQLSLIMQNSCVAACAIILLIQKIVVVGNPGFVLFVKIGVIVLGVFARLASVGSSIIIQKDWIVVIAGGDKKVLANLNSVVRRIDLFTKLLAPLVCGQVITLISLTFGCGFVAGWNIISMFIEYILLHVVYNRTPALAQKKRKPESSKKEALIENPETSREESEESRKKEASIGNPAVDQEELAEVSKKTEAGEDDKDPRDLPQNNEKQKKDTPIYAKIFGFLLVIPRGWKKYMSRPVAKAGIGLSCLYMTVLGFDSITISYAYSQCFSEVLIGILIGASGLTGIIATFLFSPLSARIGIIKTGLSASTMQVLTLIPCVLSVFVAGSPFFLLPQNKHAVPVTQPTTTEASIFNLTSSSLNVTLLNSTGSGLSNSTSTENGSVFLKCMKGIDSPSSYLSLGLLMAGMVLARIGLWGFDLAVTQLFQQRVPENERGVVGGVQSSLNHLMNLLHFALVIILPKPDQFGILVILSAAFVVAGHSLYALFAWEDLSKPPETDGS